MKTKLFAIFLIAASLAPAFAIAKPTVPRPPRVVTPHDHAPRPHSNPPVPHK